MRGATVYVGGGREKGRPHQQVGMSGDLHCHEHWEGRGREKHVRISIFGRMSVCDGSTWVRRSGLHMIWSSPASVFVCDIT